MTSAPHGILLVDKAEDRTSHDVVARVRKQIYVRRKRDAVAGDGATTTTTTGAREPA